MDEESNGISDAFAKNSKLVDAKTIIVRVAVTVLTLMSDCDCEL